MSGTSEQPTVRVETRRASRAENPKATRRNPGLLLPCPEGIQHLTVPSSLRAQAVYQPQVNCVNVPSDGTTERLRRRDQSSGSEIKGCLPQKEPEA